MVDPKRVSLIQCNVTEFVTLSDNQYKVFLTGNKPSFRFSFDVGQCFALVGCARGGGSGSVSSQLVAKLTRWIPWTATKTSSRTCPSVRACALWPQHGWARRRYACCGGLTATVRGEGAVGRHGGDRWADTAGWSLALRCLWGPSRQYVGSV